MMVLAGEKVRLEKMEPKKLTDAAEFVLKINDFNLVALMAALDDAGIPFRENWDSGATMWSFPDGSKIRVAGMGYEVTDR